MAHADEVLFLICHRFPRPVSRAFEALCFSPDNVQGQQLSRWCARVSVRFLGALRQACLLASNPGRPLNPPSVYDFRDDCDCGMFSALLSARPDPRLVQLAGEYPGGEGLDGLSILPATLPPGLVDVSLAVVEEGGFRVLCGPRMEYLVPHAHETAFLDEVPPGTVLLVDPRQGHWLSLCPLLEWRRRPDESSGHLLMLRRIDGIMGRYVEEGLPGSPGIAVPLLGRPRAGKLPVPGRILERIHDRDVRFPRGAVLGGRFEVAGIIWRGASSDVYLARDLSGGQPRVLKTFENDGRFDENYWYFINEERFSSLVDHPAVIRPRRVSIPGAGLLYEEEYASRGSLEDLITACGVLPVHRALAMVLELLDILRALHGAGVVHNDIKPDNLLFDEGRRLRLIDFGIAHRMGDAPRGLRPGSPPGTRGYMAPEFNRGAPPTPQSDLFAVGVVLARMLSGRLVQRAEVIPGIREIPREVEPFLVRCLAADPGCRFAGADAAQEFLVDVVVPRRLAVTLDVEGTLIDDYARRSPRPGLPEFLRFCLEHFSRIFVLTMLDERETAEVLAGLCASGAVPDEFLARYEYVDWDRHDGQLYKDLRLCRVALEDNALVDDTAGIVPDDQRHRWLGIEGYHERRPSDRGLERIQNELISMFAS